MKNIIRLKKGLYVYRSYRLEKHAKMWCASHLHISDLNLGFFDTKKEAEKAVDRSML